MEKYTRIRQLGKGSFGSAILIKRRSDNVLLVIKEVFLGKMSRKEREEARHECRVLQKLNHPNIVRYVEHFENRNNLYIVMEYCDGGDLHAKIKSGPLKETAILYYFSQICLAMEYLHSRHILHRDIKTMNVFLMKNGSVKLGDFGISTVLRSTMGMANTVCGTPYYFSPEICRNKPYNNKSDVWALGVLLYELATSRHPFDGSSMHQLMQRIVKGSYAPLPSHFSAEFRQMVDWCLQKDPARRPSIKQALGLAVVRRSLERLEEDLMLATQCKVRLRDIIDFDGESNGNNQDNQRREEQAKQPMQQNPSPALPSGISPGQAAALALAKQQQQQKLDKQQQREPEKIYRDGPPPSRHPPVVGPKPSATPADHNRIENYRRHLQEQYQRHAEAVSPAMGPAIQPKPAPQSPVNARPLSAQNKPRAAETPALHGRRPSPSSPASAAAAGAAFAQLRPQVHAPVGPQYAQNNNNNNHHQQQQQQQQQVDAKQREPEGFAERLARIDAIMQRYGQNVDPKARETIHAYMRRKQDEYLQRQKQKQENQRRRDDLRQRELRKVIEHQQRLGRLESPRYQAHAPQQNNNNNDNNMHHRVPSPQRPLPAPAPAPCAPVDEPPSPQKPPNRKPREPNPRRELQKERQPHQHQQPPAAVFGRDPRLALAGGFSPPSPRKGNGVSSSHQMHAKPRERPRGRVLAANSPSVFAPPRRVLPPPRPMAGSPPQRHISAPCVMVSLEAEAAPDRRRSAPHVDPLVATPCPEGRRMVRPMNNNGNRNAPPSAVSPIGLVGAGSPLGAKARGQRDDEIPASVEVRRRLLNEQQQQQQQQQQRQVAQLSELRLQMDDRNHHHPQQQQQQVKRDGVSEAKGRWYRGNLDPLSEAEGKGGIISGDRPRANKNPTNAAAPSHLDGVFNVKPQFNAPPPLALATGLLPQCTSPSTASPYTRQSNSPSFLAGSPKAAAGSRQTASKPQNSPSQPLMPAVVGVKVPPQPRPAPEEAPPVFVHVDYAVFGGQGRHGHVSSSDDVVSKRGDGQSEGKGGGNGGDLRLPSLNEALPHETQDVAQQWHNVADSHNKIALRAPPLHLPSTSLSTVQEAIAKGEEDDVLTAFQKPTGAGRSSVPSTLEALRSLRESESEELIAAAREVVAGLPRQNPTRQSTAALALLKQRQRVFSSFSGLQAPSMLPSGLPVPLCVENSNGVAQQQRPQQDDSSAINSSSPEASHTDDEHAENRAALLAVLVDAAEEADRSSGSLTSVEVVPERSLDGYVAMLEHLKGLLHRRKSTEAGEGKQSRVKTRKDHSDDAQSRQRRETKHVEQEKLFIPAPPFKRHGRLPELNPAPIAEIQSMSTAGDLPTPNKLLCTTSNPDLKGRQEEEQDGQSPHKADSEKLIRAKPSVESVQKSSESELDTDKKNKNDQGEEGDEAELKEDQTDSDNSNREDEQGTASVIDEENEDDDDDDFEDALPLSPMRCAVENDTYRRIMVKSSDDNTNGANVDSVDEIIENAFFLDAGMIGEEIEDDEDGGCTMYIGASAHSPSTATAQQ